MSLDLKTQLVAQLSAQAAVNCLPGLRLTFNSAIENGLTKPEIKEIIELALKIQKQPLSYTEHLMEQLLRETINKPRNHSCGCGCNSHS